MGLFWIGASTSFFIKLLANVAQGRALHYSED